ncbi:MAG: endopeptidase La [Verrucomicrobiaceae bacterium]|nr:endopeptidase La [Verrucomicrobiaceae bacterium]
MEDFEQLLNESSGEIIEISTSRPDATMPEWRSDLPDVIPVMPLRGVVLFPGTVAPLTVERAASRELLDELLPTGRLLALATQRDAELDHPKAEDLYEVGVLGNVLRMVRQSDEQTLVLIQIVERIHLTKFVSTKPYLKARFEILENKFPRNDDVWEATLRNLRESAQAFINLNPSIPDEASQALAVIDSPSILTDFLATNLSLDLTQKQRLLEEVDVRKRAEKVQQTLNNQLHIAELQQKLRADVEDEFSDAQRRAYLREQLRAIQRELGEGDGGEEQTDDLRIRLEAAGLPEGAMKQASRELKRLEIIPPASPEHSVIVSYLETMAELPWNKMSEDHNDLDLAREVLDRDHFGLEKVKRRLIEYLAVRKLNPHGRGPILCLLGPPGVGKTSLGHSIAEALGREFARISVGGLRDESEIRGHRRTYIGSMPGRLIQEIRRVGTRNPVIMLDEVDKIGADFRGDPASALLEVLDPRQNDTFVDRYLDVPFDLSQVIFISTANTIHPVPAPLRDRMEIIEIPGYTAEEKLQIGKRYLVKRQLKENGIKARQARWTSKAILRIIDDYTREAGVRNLEREIGSVCRAIAARVAADDQVTVSVTPEFVEEILGAPHFTREAKMFASRPGVVNGLAYTPVGGEVLNIEAIRYAGKGNIKLTGQIGDVMKESMEAAWSLVRSHADGLGIDPEDFGKYDVHVHVPAGATPKDGPSAGCAMYTALASLFADRRVNKDIAMTGEINLRGSVLPIGGLKEKALGAVQAGIKTILVPHLNLKDVPEIPESARKKLKILPMRNVDEVLAAVLLKS